MADAFGCDGATSGITARALALRAGRCESAGAVKANIEDIESVALPNFASLERFTTTFVPSSSAIRNSS